MSESKAKSGGLLNEVIQLAGVLLILTSVVAAILGFVNSITKDKIIANAAAKVSAAMQEIAPDAEEFVEIKDFTTDDKTILAVFEIRNGGAYGGLCLQVSPRGFGGEISTIVGIDAEGKILGATITQISETPGMGSKADDAKWLSQYTGLTGKLNVVKNAKTGDNDIVAISGATVTSAAVTSGVQSALDFAAAYQGGTK